MPVVGRGALAWADVMALGVAILTTAFPVGICFWGGLDIASHGSACIGSDIPTALTRMLL